MLVTTPANAFSTTRYSLFKLNLLTNLASLPSRVFVVCPVALPNPASCHEIVPTQGQDGPNQPCETGMNARGVKDMLRNKRTLFAVTLIGLLWFDIPARARIQHDTKPSSTSATADPQISSLTERAQQRDPQAQYQLGRSYMTGTNVPLDYKQARAWLQKSADQNFPDAEFALGYLHELGKGGKRNYRQALSDYTAAAEQGHTMAENNIGSMYERGEGVRRDLGQAAEWYRKAASQGQFIAACNLATLYLHGKGVPRDNAQAATWFRAAAERGYPPAQENLAWMYFTGTGVSLDFSEAAKWVHRAAELGYAPAQLDLGYLYEQGKGVPLDHIAAYMWYKTAAAGGEHRAAAQLKILSSVMTEGQIQQATAGAAELKISPPVSSAATGSSSVGNSWFPPR
jgi:TPR repeat protein